MTRPRDGKQWMADVQRRLDRLTSGLRSVRQVPVGTVVRFPAPPATLPPGWLRANGSVFTDADHPLLAEVLGSTTLPNPAPGTDGTIWIVRAD